MQKTITPPTTPILIKDLGMQFATEKSKEKRHFGLYKCVCGNEFRTNMSSVKRGATTSCGCYSIKRSKELHTTHGMRKHELYQTWLGILKRTQNVNFKHFKNYGGRGITVCDRWLHSFQNFYDDMFPSWIKGLSIDRINNDGNYEPSNCRWVTMNVQARNTRRLCSVNTSGHRGVSKCGKKWLSSICINNKKIRIGIFDDIIEAAKAYDQYVIDNNLEHTINGV